MKHLGHHDHKDSHNRIALSATLHCLSGCAVGEVVGMVIGTFLDWSTFTTTLIAITLAFIFGFSLSTFPLLKAGAGFIPAISVVLAADTMSITTMEITDNLVIVLIPGALHAGLGNLLFWISLALSLVAAFIVAYPVNRYLLSKGKGHALLMKYHDHN